MIVVTITIGLLAVALGCIAFINNKKAVDAKIKFDNIKDFADKAGKRILELEKDKAGLANQVIMLQARGEIVIGQKPTNKPTVEGQVRTNKPKRSFRPKHNNNNNKPSAVK